MITHFIRTVEINRTMAGFYEARVLFGLADGTEECFFFKFLAFPLDTEIEIVAQNFIGRQKRPDMEVLTVDPIPLPPARRLGMLGRLAFWLIKVLQKWVK